MERRRREEDRAAEDTTILEDSSEKFDRATDEAVVSAEEGVVYSQEAIEADEESDDPPGVPDSEELADELSSDAPTGESDPTPNEPPPSVADQTGVISETVTASEAATPGPGGPDPSGGDRSHDLDVFEMGLGIDRESANESMLNVGHSYTETSKLPDGRTETRVFHDVPGGHDGDAPIHQEVAIVVEENRDDGSTIVHIDHKDGSTTDGVRNPDGSSYKVDTSADGKITTTTEIRPDGSQVVTVTTTNDDGSSTTTTVESDESGEVVSSETTTEPPPEGEQGEPEAAGGDESAPPPEEDATKPDAGQPDRFTEDGPGLGPGGQLLEDLGEWARDHQADAMAGSNVTPNPEGVSNEGDGEPMWDAVPSVAIPPDDMANQPPPEMPAEMPAPGGNTEGNINWGPDHVEASEPATDNSQFEERSASEIADGGLEEEIAGIDDQGPPTDKGSDLDASQMQPDLTIVEEEDEVTRETSDGTLLDIEDDAYPRHEFGAPSEADSEQVQLDLDDDEQLQDTVRSGDYQIGAPDSVDDVIPAASDQALDEDDSEAGQERSSEESMIAQPQIEMPAANGDPVPRHEDDEGDLQFIEPDETASTDRVASGNSEPTTPSAANTDVGRSAEPDSELDDLIFSGDSEPTTPSMVNNIASGDYEPITPSEADSVESGDSEPTTPSIDVEEPLEFDAPSTHTERAGQDDGTDALSNDLVFSGDSEPTTPSKADGIASGDPEPTTPSVPVPETPTVEPEEAIGQIELGKPEIVNVEVSAEPMPALEPDVREDDDEIEDLEI